MNPKPMTEEQRKLQFKREMHHSNIRERQEWSQPALSYDEYATMYKEYLDDEWMKKQPRQK